jgi:thioredoxin 2
VWEGACGILQVRDQHLSDSRRLAMTNTSVPGAANAEADARLETVLDRERLLTDFAPVALPLDVPPAQRRPRKLASHLRRPDIHLPALARHVDIACPHCDLVNHVPEAEFDREARCKRCEATLLVGSVFDLTAANVELHVRASHVPIAVVFWAPWCKPCHTVLALAERVARALDPRIRFARVNTDKERELVLRYGVRGIPTVLLFKRGKESARRIGNVDLQTIAAWADA